MHLRQAPYFSFHLKIEPYGNRIFAETRNMERDIQSGWNFPIIGDV